MLLRVCFSDFSLAFCLCIYKNNSKEPLKYNKICCDRLNTQVRYHLGVPVSNDLKPFYPQDAPKRYKLRLSLVKVGLYIKDEIHLPRNLTPFFFHITHLKIIHATVEHVNIESFSTFFWR